MRDDLVLRADDGAVTTLTLNAPQSLNVLSMAMVGALDAALARLAGDRRIRVVILRGAGRCFSAGHDLKEMQAARGAPDGGRQYFEELFSACARMMLRLPALPQPVIAEVHGVAAAAGCQLVASCDLAVAASGTRFGVNGVNIGLFCATPMVPLSRNVPRKAAFEMLTTGALIDAERAREIGLLNRVVPAEDLAREARALADIIAAKLTAAVAIGKRAFYDQIEMTLEGAYAHAGQVMVENLLWRDTEEGIAAFLDKSAPDRAE